MQVVTELEAAVDRLHAVPLEDFVAERKRLATVREKARPNGRELSEPMVDRVRDLLQAATADPEAAERLRAGRAVEGADEQEPEAAGRAPGGDEGTGRAEAGVAVADDRDSKSRVAAADDRDSKSRVAAADEPAAKGRGSTDRAAKGRGSTDRAAERRAAAEARAAKERE